MEDSALKQQDEQVPCAIKDNSKRAKTLTTIFWIYILVTAIGLFSGYNELQIYKRAQLGEYPTDMELQLSNLLQGVMGITQFGVYIASIVLFLNWFRRAYANLYRAGINYLRHKEAMTVWAWAIPIVAWYRPVQIMNEIWTETQEKIKSCDSSYAIQSGGLLLGVWWTFFILSTITSNYVFRTIFKQDTLEQLIDNSTATLINDIVQIPEALLVILIVYRLSKMESRMLAEIKNQEAI